MRTRLLTLFAVGLLSLPLATAAAGSLDDRAAEAERLAGEALAKMMKALDLLMTTVPHYAAPEILPNGDIIIRRLDPEDGDEEPIETDGDSEET